MDNQNYKRLPLSILMAFLFISPLCVYLQSMFFANTNIFSTLYIILNLVFLLFHANFKILIDRENCLVALFVSIMMLSALAGGAWLYFLQSLLLFAFVVIVYDADYLSRGLKILELVGIVCAIGCILQILFNSFYNSFIELFFKNSVVITINRLYNWDKSACGFMPQTSHAAGIVLTALFLVSFDKKNRQKGLYWLELIILLIALLLTNKRAHFAFGMVALFCGLIVGENMGKKTKRIIWILFGLSIAVALALWMLPLLSKDSTIASLIYTLQNLNNPDVDISSDRNELAKIAIEMIHTAPITGHGWGYYKANNVFQTDAHNVYLQLFAESGIFVLVIFIGLIGSSLIKTIHSLRQMVFVEEESSYKYLLKVSFCMQLFFALYCLTGNCLYNIDFWAIYVLSVAILCCVRRQMKNAVNNN